MILITILTIIAFPLLGHWCFLKGRELLKFEDEQRLNKIIKHIEEYGRSISDEKLHSVQTYKSK